VYKSALCVQESNFSTIFSLLSVLKVRVVAGDSQIRMTNLILHEVTGHHAHLHVADSTMSESVHPTGFDSEFFAERRENPSANIPIFEWRAQSGLEEPAGLTANKEVTKHPNCSGVYEHVPLPTLRLRVAFDAVPHSAANFNHTVFQLQVFNTQARKFTRAQTRVTKQGETTPCTGQLRLLRSALSRLA
jgi:hypothetical protein